MLTEVDIHFLVGLLMTVHSPDAVTVELGSRVNDVACKKRRDVDIVVSSAGSGCAEVIFCGIEVKAHSRPLDSTHVEQLALKLMDMPELMHRAVVSASGFTNGALNKAQAHDLTPYSLEAWPSTDVTFADIRVAGGFKFSLVEPKCKLTRSGSMLFMPTERLPDAVLSQFAPTLAITSPQHLVGMTLSEFGRQLINRPVKELLGELPVGETAVELEITLGDRPHVTVAGRDVELEKLLIRATIETQIERPVPIQRVLRNVLTNEIYGGCAVAEQSPGHLLGVIFGRKDRNARLIVISEADRNLKVIRNRLLPS